VAGRETQDDIKAGRQLKKFLYTPLESIEDQTPSVTSVDPLPPAIPSSVASSEPGVIHDVIDQEEIFISATIKPYVVKCSACSRTLPVFYPPAPSLIDGVIRMFEMRQQSLMSDSFKLSLSRVF
jgi:hypothetical protein